MTELHSESNQAAITGPVLAQFRELAAGLAGLDSVGRWGETVSLFAEYFPGGSTAPRPGQLGDLGSWERIAARIERCVVDGRPASFIRLGDGEGNLLALALDEYSALTEHCVRAISLRKFGSSETLLCAAPEALPRFHAALRNADLIGFPERYSLATQLVGPNSESRARPIHGLASVYTYLTRFANDLELGSKAGASSSFSRGLLRHYQALVSERKIGIVTCHRKLAEALRVRMGARAVDLRPVPPQALVMGDRGTPSDTGHWPDRYHALVDELRCIEPGNLWFVAAGILGKIYCEVIRRAGGIAVDVGHTADLWAGFRSRGPYTPADLLTEWRLV